MGSVDKIIDAFGSATQMGLAIGATRQAVSNMRARGSIPATYWKALVEAAEERQLGWITYELLADIAAENRGNDQRAEAGAQ